MKRRDLLKLGAVLVPVAGGVMQLDGQAWNRVDDSDDREAIVYLYGRLRTQGAPGQYTPERFDQWFDKEAEQLKRDFRVMAAREQRTGWPSRQPASPYWTDDTPLWKERA